MSLLMYSTRLQRWIRPSSLEGTVPKGRNGHTATLATDPDDEEHGRIIIIGGWLGSGPLAASDMHVLDVREGGQRLRWIQPTVFGKPPGPCNMHSADFVASRREVYVFRGGNGREYLHDLHALHVDTYTWRHVETTGQIPQQRANHSSAMLEESNELVIFGGWNGTERLNDIHILDTNTSTWSCPQVGGVLPHPRAGMTLTALRGRLFLLGGSGTSSKCFQDLQILDRKEMAWLDVMHHKEKASPLKNSSYYDPDDFFANGWRRGGNSSSNSNNSHHGAPSRLSSANPNDEETVPTIIVHGQGPGRRAGHTATAVNRQIYIFGGSCGSDYLNDFFVLDTDPQPRANVTEPNSLQLLDRRLRHFFNDEEFSDVTFLVEGKKVYGHRMILSIVSDCFRAMFTNGFKESEAGTEIEIPNCTYDAFVSMMEYIYSGQAPPIDVAAANGIEKVVDLLELADQFFLDHLKQICEKSLQPFVNGETVESLSQVAQKTNASQLMAICTHYQRNPRVWEGQDPTMRRNSFNHR